MGGSALANGLVVLVATLTAGCLQPAGEGDASPRADASPDVLSEPAVRVLTWRAYVAASAAYDVAPSMQETARPFETLGFSAPTFHLQLNETPQDMTVLLEWDAVAARLALMLIPPTDDGHGVPYETEVAGESPLCVRVPPEGLRAGDWGVMVHPEAAVEARLDFTVTLSGGSGHVVDERFRLPVREFVPAAAAKGLATANGQAPVFLSCPASSPAAAYGHE